uniref:Uncharacterized protein n=1 Tax=Arundo donax TaxID=35708 RepID=A0A0A9BR60_ARUDO
MIEFCVPRLIFSTNCPCTADD